jgi:hypothetical protein
METEATTARACRRGIDINRNGEVKNIARLKRLWSIEKLLGQDFLRGLQWK